MNLLKKQQIWEVQDLKREVVEVPEWGGSVIVREPTAAERDAYDNSLVHSDIVGDKTVIKSDFENQKARLVARCVINEDGSRMFEDAEITKLGTKSAAVISRLFSVISRLGLMGMDGKKSAEGNSEPGLPAASSSASPAI